MPDHATVISVIGLGIAILSAVYASRAAASAHRQARASEGELAEARNQTKLARESLDAARRQNDIDVHGHRLAVFKALLSTRRGFLHEASGKSRTGLDELQIQGELSRFCFPSEIGEAIRGITADIIILRQLSEQVGRTGFYTDEEMARVRARRYALHVETEASLVAAIEKTRQFMEALNSALPPTPKQ